MKQSINETSDAFGEVESLLKTTAHLSPYLTSESEWQDGLGINLANLLHSKNPTLLLWGEENRCFYNDAFIPCMDYGKHPESLGERAEVLFLDAWKAIEKKIHQVKTHKTAIERADQFRVIRHRDWAEETYWSYSYSPAFQNDGAIGGIFIHVIPTTDKILAGRRLHLVHDLTESVQNTSGQVEYIKKAQEVLEDDQWDIPYSLMLMKKGQRFSIVHSSGLVPEEGKEFEIDSVFLENANMALENMASSHVNLSPPWDLKNAAFDKKVENSYIVPFQTGHETGVFFFGLSPQLRFTGQYQSFLDQVAMEMVNGLQVKRVRQLEKRGKRLLKNALNAADEANQAKADFLANVSHEIRTPMTAILGFTEILRDADSGMAQRLEAIKRIDRSGHALLKLIDDILDISSVESGKINIDKIRFSPYELVSEVISLLKMNSEQKQLNVVLKMTPTVPDIAYTDAVRLRQVLVNLIGNAIKFTKRGGVEISVDAFENRFLSFEIRDSGVGINPKEQQKLFRPFARGDESMTRQFGGTGLGLALSKRICERLGGSLELVESELGKGSTFRALIEAGPFESYPHWQDQPPLTNKPKVVPSNSLKGKLVLVVEDVPDNQILIRFYLEGAGARVEIAKNGEEAVAKASKKPYDVILMDIQMPIMDGIKATEVLRDKGYAKPILALTAHAMKDEVMRSLNAGCNEHLTKPIDRQSLVHTVARYTLDVPHTLE